MFLLLSWHDKSKECKEKLNEVKMEPAKVNSKGQITIPIDIRKRYGLQEGSKILFLEGFIL